VINLYENIYERMNMNVNEWIWMFMNVDGKNRSIPNNYERLYECLWIKER